MKISDITMIAAGVALLVIGASAYPGRLFRWVDDSGQVHYSDRKPMGEIAQEKHVRSASGEGGDNAMTGIRPEERQLLNAAARSRTGLKRARIETARRRQADKAACDRAREKYKMESHRTGSDSSHYKSSFLKGLYKEMREVCR